jgi:hypothetical protein
LIADGVEKNCPTNTKGFSFSGKNSPNISVDILFAG